MADATTAGRASLAAFYERRPTSVEDVDPLLRDLVRATHIQKNPGTHRWFFRPKKPPKEKIPMKPSPRPSLSKIDQHDLALQAVRNAKKDTHGFTTTGETWTAYLALAIPPPYVHIGERHFRDLLRDLHIEGRLELHLVSRGAHGQTTYIREKPPEAPAPGGTHAET